MEKLALVSLFTQSSEPVLTHHRLLSTDVTERTHPTWKWKQKFLTHTPSEQSVFSTNIVSIFSISPYSVVCYKSTLGHLKMQIKD